MEKWIEKKKTSESGLGRDHFQGKGCERMRIPVFDA